MEVRVRCPEAVRSKGKAALLKEFYAVVYGLKGTIHSTRIKEEVGRWRGG